MSIWNKILIGLIIVASLGLFVMSAWALKAQKYWGSLAEKYNASIINLQKEDQVLKVGDSTAGIQGIEQVRSELNKLIVDRQRVWYKCDPEVTINRQAGTVSVKVNVEQPNPSGIANKSILFAFEEAPAAQKGRYLGEFKVTAVGDKQITLEPAFKILPTDMEKMATAKRPWNLYDSLPHDNPEVLGQKSDQRLLREYGYLFDAYRMKITELMDHEEAAVRDLQMVEDSLADAKKQVQFYQNQTTVFKVVLEKFTRQRDAVKTHLDKILEKIAETQAAAAKFIEDNKAMAGQIAKIQFDATRRIDQRTRAMAQSANGEN